jgi:hypothetical protein
METFSSSNNINNDDTKKNSCIRSILKGHAKSIAGGPISERFGKDFWKQLLQRSGKVPWRGPIIVLKSKRRIVPNIRDDEVVNSIDQRCDVHPQYLDMDMVDTTELITFLWIVSGTGIGELITIDTEKCIENLLERASRR